MVKYTDKLNSSLIPLNLKGLIHSESNMEVVEEILVCYMIASSCMVYESLKNRNRTHQGAQNIEYIRYRKG